MKKVLFLLPVFILLCCSVQKRKYQRGYYVNWKHEGKKIEGSETARKKPANTIVPAESLVAQKTIINEQQNNNSSLLAAKSENIKSVLKVDPCDDLIFNDGTEIKGVVKEITATEVKYKRCDMPDGPMYTVKKSALFMVKYSNGTRQLFKTEEGSAGNTTPGAQGNIDKRTNHPLATIALIFAIVGIWPLTFIGSIVGLILGIFASQKIKERPDLYKGESMALTAKILSLIMLALVIIIVVVLVAVMI